MNSKTLWSGQLQFTEYCMGIHKETLGSQMNKVLLQSITPINNSKGNEMS